ncbi:MAG: prolipoprotein diacylglyceryl transferase [Anaerovoracaceae bacterium]|jgi:phosphatidylglycerol:prolipoprotein diacylglycerol transferase
MFLPIPNPIAFTIFGFDVRWYGVCLTIGIFLGILLTYKRAPGFQLDPEKVIDVLLVSIPAGIIGARLYYVIFNWEYYSKDLWQILNYRAGGLAIHGALIFGITAAIIMCRIWKIPISKILDLAAPGIAFAQSIGRWGNYFNGEAHGIPTTLPWAIQVNGQMVHPTFLYESLWCFALGVLLIQLSKQRKFNGQIFLIYGMLYSIERFFVEGLRTDSLMVGNTLRTAQIASVLILTAFSITYLIVRKRHGKIIPGGEKEKHVEIEENNP